MSAYRAVLLALFVAGAALVAAVPAGATLQATPDRPSLRDPGVAGATGVAVTANHSANNSSLGADVSSFMQSSAAEVDGAVESGMWTASFNSTENRSKRVRLVERRTSELEERLADLRQRKAELLAEREAGNLSETAYKAKVSRLIGQINALESSINATSSRAKQVNANVDRLETLRTETENLSGPEIAAVARNVTGVGDGQRGPPDRAGPGSESGNDEGAGGPPDHAGAANNTTNASKRSGPPSDAGEASMASNASGNATGTGPGNASGNISGNGAANVSSNGPGNVTDNGPVNATGNGTANGSANASDARGNPAGAGNPDSAGVENASDGVGNATADGVKSAAGNRTGNGVEGAAGNGNGNGNVPVESVLDGPTTAGLFDPVSDAFGAPALGRTLAGA